MLGIKIVVVRRRSCFASSALLMFVAALSALTCQAEDKKDEKPIKGCFYVHVDDAAKIYVNGELAHDTGIGQSRSSDLELKVGDHVVAQLRNDSGPRGFMLVFASSDEQKVISFKSRDFKIVTELDVTDFTAKEFEKWKKFAKNSGGRSSLPVKSHSEWVWGDLEKSILACTISKEMVEKRIK